MVWYGRIWYGMAWYGKTWFKRLNCLLENSSILFCAIIMIQSWFLSNQANKEECITFFCWTPCVNNSSWMMSYDDLWNGMNLYMTHIWKQQYTINRSTHIPIYLQQENPGHHGVIRNLKIFFINTQAHHKQTKAYLIWQ